MVSRRWPPVVLVSASVASTFAARGDGPFAGETGVTLWIHRNSPGPVDRIGDVLEPLFTDLAAPAVFAATCLFVWWRWGLRAIAVLGLAGVLTALTRVGDLVQRPRPTASGSWSSYAYGNGGYPSGHVVFVALISGTLAILARRHASTVTARWVAGVGATLAVVTSWTRVSHLEHWPLDVVGGLTMAGAALYGVATFDHRLDNLMARRRPTGVCDPHGFDQPG